MVLLLVLLQFLLNTAVSYSSITGAIAQVTHKQQQLMSYSLKAWKSEIRVPGWLGSTEVSLLGLKTVIFSPCAHIVGRENPRQGGRDKEKEKPKEIDLPLFLTPQSYPIRAPP